MDGAGLSRHAPTTRHIVTIVNRRTADMVEVVQRRTCDQCSRRGTIAAIHRTS